MKVVVGTEVAVGTYVAVGTKSVLLFVLAAAAAEGPRYCSIVSLVFLRVPNLNIFASTTNVTIFIGAADATLVRNDLFFVFFFLLFFTAVAE